MEGDAPKECTPTVMTAIVTQHMESPSMWVIFPIQVLTSLHQRFNLISCGILANPPGHL